MVAPAIVRDGVDCLDPIVAMAIDAVVRAERARSIQFGGAARDDHLRPVRLRDLETEQGDTTAARNQHRSPALTPTRSTSANHAVSPAHGSVQA